jgi:hypothetical protein
MASKKTSKQLDSDRNETKAEGEKKQAGGGRLMDGIVGGISRRVCPPVVDGIVRGISHDTSPGLGGQMSKIAPGATPHDRGTFGSGIFAQGK